MNKQQRGYTDPTFWDREWNLQKLHEYVDQRINNQILKYIKPVLVHQSKVLEIGCVPARRLSFLHRQYGLKTYGLDYSLSGLLKSNRISELICADILSIPFKSSSFDLVYSLGVIEHFSDPINVVKQHLELVKERGVILVTIPNFYNYSILSIAYKIAGKYEEVTKTHNLSIMLLQNFRKLFTELPVQELICNYYGPPVLIPPPNLHLRRLAARINNRIDKIGIRSKLFSPELVFIGKKVRGH